MIYGKTYRRYNLMVKSLYCKLAAVLVGTFCLIGVLYILLTLYTTRLYLWEMNQKLNSTLAQDLAAETDLIKNGRINEKALQDILPEGFFFFLYLME